MAGASRGASIGGTGAAATRSGGLANPTTSLAWLRLSTGSGTLLGMLLFVFGTSWDIQWHTFIGRDRALVPPHLLMLGGIVLAGVAALSNIAVESFWARANPAVARSSTPFAGAFHGSLGGYVAGFGALAAGVGFPLDVYWHAIYGIDVSVWAPFHVQIITGMAIVGLGCAYMLLSGANLAASTGQAQLGRIGRIGLSVAAAAMIAALLFFLDASFSNASLRLAGLRIDTYPLMVGLAAGFGFALVAAARPGRFAATGVALVFYALDALAFVAVPPLTDSLAAAENQSFRDGPQTYVVVSYVWPATLILLAAAIDLAMGFARRRGWAWERTTALVRWASAGGTVVVSLLYPVYLLTALSVAHRFDGSYALFALVMALLIGGLGGWLGSWVGMELGASLGRADR